MACLLSVGGQQTTPGPWTKYAKPKTQHPRTDSAKQIANLTERVDGLNSVLVAQAKIIDDLNNRVYALESGSAVPGRYQIAANTSPPADPAGLPFSQVFRLDTQTSYVCQVVSSKVVKGELVGTTLPYCTE